MSASEDSLFTRPFASMLFPVHRAHAPYCYRCPLGLDRATCAVDCLGDLERLLTAQGNAVAAVLVEPMLQGAGGMIVWPAEFLGRRPAAVRSLRRADDRRRSADRIRPDRPHVRVRARGGVAGHHLPVEGAHRRLSAARRDGDHRGGVRRVPQRRPHERRSSTATRSRPIRWRAPSPSPASTCSRTPARSNACAGSKAGCGDGLGAAGRAAVRRRGPRHRRRRHRRAGDGQGGQDGGGYLDDIGPRLAAAFLDRGLLLRPLGNILYFMPPYVITESETAWAIEQIREVRDTGIGCRKAIIEGEASDAYLKHGVCGVGSDCGGWRVRRRRYRPECRCAPRRGHMASAARPRPGTGPAAVAAGAGGAQPAARCSHLRHRTWRCYISRAAAWRSRQTQVRNGFGPADWYPNDHPAMPDVVAHGKAPDARPAVCATTRTARAVPRMLPFPGFRPRISASSCWTSGPTSGPARTRGRPTRAS